MKFIKLSIFIIMPFVLLSSCQYNSDKVDDRLRKIEQTLNSYGKEADDLTPFSKFNPYSIDMGNKKLLCIPSSKVNGKDISITQEFYILENNTLKKVKINE